jgi:hypothetical protein
MLSFRTEIFFHEVKKNDVRNPLKFGSLVRAILYQEIPHIVFHASHEKSPFGMTIYSYHINLTKKK